MNWELQNRSCDSAALPAGADDKDVTFAFLQIKPFVDAIHNMTVIQQLTLYFSSARRDPSGMWSLEYLPLSTPEACIHSDLA